MREEPAPIPLQGFYLRVFWELSTERQLGMAMGPIPHSKIIEYGSRRGFGPGMMRLLEGAMRAMDRVYTTWVTDQHKPKK